MEEAAMPYNPDEGPHAEIIQQAEAQFMTREGVVGVGIGNSPTGDDALVVYVIHDGAAKTLPATFSGLEIVPVVSGIIEAD